MLLASKFSLAPASKTAFRSSSDSQMRTVAPRLISGPLRRARLAKRADSILCFTAPSGGKDTATSTVQQYYLKLQNGSDVRGIALAGVDTEPVDLTAGNAYYIAKAFGQWLAKKTGTTVEALSVGVGRDPRLSGPTLSNACIIGLASLPGLRVADCGIASTPACFMGTVLPEFNFDGSIMLTASHLPFNRNGLKFFRRKGGLEKADITEVLTLAAQLHSEDLGTVLDHTRTLAPLLRAALETADSDRVFKEKLLDSYSAHLRRLIVEGVNHPQHRDQPLKGLKAMVDAGNGSGGFFAEKVLGPLGADVSSSQFLTPDGSFPNHQPNPENKAAMESAAEAVLKHKADVGIVFDTDVDRAALVDRDGKEINRNRLIALMASIVLQKSPGSTIVTDSVTSNGLATFIEKKGGVHLRYKRGYKNVINKGIELNEQGTKCNLMIETSGHGAFGENFFLDDGAYIAVQAMILLMKQRLAGNANATLGDLIADLREPVEEAELRFAVKDRANHRKEGEASVAAFTEWVTKSPPKGWSVVPVNHEGCRVDVDQGNGLRGWVLLRQSLHDPLVVMNIESEVPGQVGEIKKVLKAGWGDKVKDKVDIAPLQ